MTEFLAPTATYGRRWDDNYGPAVCTGIRDPYTPEPAYALPKDDAHPGRADRARYDRAARRLVPVTSEEYLQAARALELDFTVKQLSQAVHVNPMAATDWLWLALGAGVVTRTKLPGQGGSRRWRVTGATL